MENFIKVFFDLALSHPVLIILLSVWFAALLIANTFIFIDEPDIDSNKTNTCIAKRTRLIAIRNDQM